MVVVMVDAHYALIYIMHVRKVRLDFKHFIS